MNFLDLDLTHVDASGGRKTLRRGQYICKVAEARVVQNKEKNGCHVYLKLEDEMGTGYVEDRFNIMHTSSPKTEEIGLQQLKAFLIAARHPNPDRPGDISSLRPLRVGVWVEDGESWVDGNGQEKKGGGQPRQFDAYFPVDANTVVKGPMGSPAQQQPSQSSHGFDDSAYFG